MNPASITRRTRRDSLDLGFSVIQQTLDIVVGTGGVGGQGVDGGGDVAEAALEACDTDEGLAGVLTDLGDQRTLGELIGGDGGVVRRVSGAEGPGHLVVVVVIELEEVVDALLLSGVANLGGDPPVQTGGAGVGALVPSGYT